MYPLHQSYIRRITTRPLLRLIDTLSWCNPQSVNRNGSTNEIYGSDSFRSCERNRSHRSIDGDDEDIENTEDDNVNLWDLRKNLESNIVAFRKESEETCSFSNGSLACASRKAKKLKDMKYHCGWFGCNIQDSPITDDGRYAFEESHQLEGDADALQLNGAAEFNASNRNLLPCGLSQTVADVDVQSGNVFDLSSASVSPESLSSDSMQTQSPNLLDERSVSEVTSSDISNTRSPADEITSFPTRYFRRSTARRHHTTASYYGYSLERDFCVDSSTDRVFKEYITSNPTAHTPRRATLQRSKATQLRRQVMRKQYSDTAAVYYGQQMRRWRMQKQRSDSVNCPVDRGVLRRQGRIQEELFCDEMQKDQKRSSICSTDLVTN